MRKRRRLLTRVHRFPCERLVYRDDRDYEERFRELLADAVGSRMRRAARSVD